MSKKFTYELELAGVAGKCQTWTNTATVEESSSQDVNNSDSADVEVCAEAPLITPPTPPVEPPAPTPPAPPVAQASEPTPLVDTGADESLLWMIGTASAVIIAGALMLMRYRRKAH